MLTLLEAPEPILSLPEAKAHLGISHTRDDVMIEAQIASAVAFLDGPNGYLASAIAPQKWEWKTGAFSDPLRLPLGPMVSIDEVRYRNADNVETIMDLTTVYLFGDAISPFLRPIGQWPSDVSSRDDAVTVEFTAGRAVIPPQLISAAKLIVGQLYRYREVDVDVRNFPTSFSMYDLAHPYRVSF